jgi:hypothetical protein
LHSVAVEKRRDLKAAPRNACSLSTKEKKKGKKNEKKSIALFDFATRYDGFLWRIGRQIARAHFAARARKAVVAVALCAGAQQVGHAVAHLVAVCQAGALLRCHRHRRSLCSTTARRKKKKNEHDRKHCHRCRFTVQKRAPQPFTLTGDQPT